MLSKRHPELDPLGSDIRKHNIPDTKEWTDVCRYVLVVVLHRYQLCVDIGDKHLVFLLDTIVESYRNYS
jgi:hypothetical protein